ncbi:hypothetical protein AAMO2058_001321000 [Amorphochlora amoebiformis]
MEWDPNPKIEDITCGLRGPMGSGYNRMNDLTVIQASQGLCAYIKELNIEAKKPLKISIAYDHRASKDLNISSETFGKLTACVALEAGFEVYLFEGYTATPLVPFLVRKECMDSGVVVTASHNPKEDNGYKVYWKTGSQIVPPHDANISAYISKNLKPWKKYSPEGVYKHKNCFNPTKRVFEEYFKTITPKLCRYPNLNKSSDVKIVYTAMHGLGYKFTSKALLEFGFAKFECVEEQKEPNPDFPTVKFPNPEEKGGANLVLANDPDADRLAVAEKTSDGKWNMLSGNEIGILLADWQWTCYKKDKPSDDYSNVYMLNSTVSSKMLKSYAAREGFQYLDTLTGFKWMGNTAYELEKKGKKVLFMFEEAIGFCVGDVVFDKDGISAAAVFAEMATYLKAEKKITVTDHLDNLYRKYGYFLSHNYYVKSNNTKVIEGIFARLRNQGNYWFRCGPYLIKNIRDLKTGYDSSQVDSKAILPVSNVLTGTEPKLKYYIELSGETPESTRKALNEMVRTLVVSMLEPEKNGLKYQLP